MTDAALQNRRARLDTYVPPLLSLHRPSRAALRMVTLVGLTLLALPFYLLISPIPPLAHGVLRRYWRIMLRVTGMRLTVEGALAKERPLLCLSNHISYLDIMILGAVIPGRFVSKAEVRRWPGVGLLALIARTKFIERRGTLARTQADTLAKSLERGAPMILFPEGTSSDGNRILPFKSALLAAAQATGGAARVQPVTVTYTALDGLPLGYGWQSLVAWYGDMDMASHLWRVLGMGMVSVTVTLHPALDPGQIGDRKALAKYARDVVVSGRSLCIGSTRRRALRALSAPAMTEQASPDASPVL